MDRLTCAGLKAELAFLHCDQCSVQLTVARSCCHRVCTEIQALTVAVLKCFGFDSADEALDSSIRVNVAVESEQHLEACCIFAEDCYPNLPVAAALLDLRRFPCSVDSVAALLSFADPFAVSELQMESESILVQACEKIAGRERSNCCSTMIQHKMTVTDPISGTDLAASFESACSDEHLTSSDVEQ